jgi:hypothetical protein
VRRNVSLTCLLLAWAFANGAVWNVAQAIAWSRMFATYARTLRVTEALRETLDPAKPCQLCVAVQQARTAEREQHSPALPEVARIDLAVESTTFFVLSPPSSAWPQLQNASAEARSEAVPVPPPRV